MWVVYEKAYFAYRENRKKVQNPFAKMVFQPSLCEFYKCMNKFLEVPSGFLNFQDSRTGNATERVTIMIYNDNFKKMQTQFPNYRYFHIGHICICTIMILLSYLFLYNALGVDQIVSII